MDKHWMVIHGLAYSYDEKAEIAHLTPKGLQALREWLAPYSSIIEEN